MVEEAGLIETQRVGEELCLETGAELDSSQEVLTAESPQLLPGLEGKEAPLGDHCYARSGSLAHENRQSSHSSGHPVQVNSGIYLALLYYSCQNGKKKNHLENDGRSDANDRLEFKIFSNCCDTNCCNLVAILGNVAVFWKIQWYFGQIQWKLVFGTGFSFAPIL